MSHAKKITANSANAYRDLVSDFAGMEPLHGFADISDLPELDRHDFEVILRANPTLVEQLKTIDLDYAVNTVKLHLLAAVQAECEIRNERRAELRDEELRGGGYPMTDGERAEHDFGVRSLFR